MAQDFFNFAKVAKFRQIVSHWLRRMKLNEANRLDQGFKTKKI